MGRNNKSLSYLCYLLLVTSVLSCNGKKIQLSADEQKLENRLSAKYDCKVTFMIDERSVGMKRNDGTYNVEFDFTGFQNLCEIDSLTIMNMIDYSFDQVANEMSFKKNHKFINIEFTEIVKIDGIETSHCMKWYKLYIADRSIESRSE